MNIHKFLILITAFILTTFAGCGGNQPAANTEANANTSNANAAAPNSGSLEPTKKPETATTNNAPTLAPVVQAYYDALKKKDDAAVRKVLSADLIKSLEAQMKAEKKTSLAAYSAETDTVPDKPVEVRNEKIEGNKAVAELKGGAYLNWTPLAFVKEDGEWKMSNESPDIISVKESANTSTNPPANVSANNKAK